MARGHIDMPTNTKAFNLNKRNIFSKLMVIDNDNSARDRILRMETDFRKRIDSHISSLPAASAQFQKFNTSPFVLMFYSRQKGYRHVSEIEKDIVPAKVFSSMETSAGRMVETVVLPIYGWTAVPSVMHSSESVLDGKKESSGCVFKGATLKSGPRCLNDEMAKDIGIDIVTHANIWARSNKATEVEFTYGVLYGTKKQSNKKDWHILRNIQQTIPKGGNVITPCRHNWSISYSLDNVTVNASVRVGVEWWEYLGGPNAWIELCIALIRACIDPADVQKDSPSFIIRDLASILDHRFLNEDYNVSLLQRSQFEWLLFLARHFCDELTV